MKTITVELPDDTFVAARRSPTEAAQDMRLALATYWYQQGLVSQGMAARIANLPRAALMRAMSLISVSPFQETLDDIRRALDE